MRKTFCRQKVSLVKHIPTIHHWQAVGWSVLYAFYWMAAYSHIADRIPHVPTVLGLWKFIVSNESSLYSPLSLSLSLYGFFANQLAGNTSARALRLYCDSSLSYSDINGHSLCSSLFQLINWARLRQKVNSLFRSSEFGSLFPDSWVHDDTWYHNKTRTIQ